MLCVITCAKVHGEKEVSDSRIRVYRVRNPNGQRASIAVCTLCTDISCLHACKSGALKLVDDRIVLEREKCVKCLKCVDACRYGSAFVSSTGYPLICDMCGGDPACVKVCPTDAIVIG